MNGKFDENKWRILAMNKPDELHSYVPQSSIVDVKRELSDAEINELGAQEAEKRDKK